MLIAQFLTAFGDNALLFTAFTMLSQQAAHGEWYKPAMQASFLLSFVLLAPWVGGFADRYAKGRVLAVGNAAKAAGALLLMIGFDPLIAYGIVGVGAAIYGPAKYGILPELAPHDRLVKANGWVEGSTIIAIVLGAVIGAHLADLSITTALWTGYKPIVNTYFEIHRDRGRLMLDNYVVPSSFFVMFDEWRPLTGHAKA